MKNWMKTGRQANLDWSAAGGQAARERFRGLLTTEFSARDACTWIYSTLAAIKQGIEETLGGLDEQHAAKSSLASLLPLVDVSMDECDRVSSLQPFPPGELGLLAGVRSLVGIFEDLCPRIQVEIHFGVKESDLLEHLKAAVYGIIVHAFGILADEGDSQRVCLALSDKEGALELSIQADGRGFRVDDHPRKVIKALELILLKQRTDFSKGKMEVETSVTGGTTLRFKWFSRERFTLGLETERGA
jgi:signal transduction histidine kinase